MADEVPGTSGLQAIVDQNVDEALAKDRAERARKAELRASGELGKSLVVEHKTADAGVSRANGRGARGSGAPGKAFKPFGPEDYVDVYMSKDLKARFREWLDGPECPDLGAILHAFDDQGLNLSIKREAEPRGSDGFIRCVVVSDGARRGMGKPSALTAWASTLDRAVRLAYFKHEFLLGRDWDRAGIGGAGDEDSDLR